MPQWWPAGATEAHARACGCDYCRDLLDRLDEHRDGIAVDGKHATIASFGQS
jgi:hypothetical protein